MPEVMGTARQEFDKRFNSLKEKHQKYVPAYQELSRYINPTRGIFNGDREKIGQMIDHKTLINSYATHALRIFASGMNSGMTNKSSQWFRPTFDDPAYLEIPGARDALDQLKNRMYSILNGSNMYDVFYQAYEEIGQFGPACFLVLEDFEDTIRGRSFTAGEYFLGIDSKGRVNAFGREFELTVSQMVEEFGLSKCSEQVQAHYNNNRMDERIKIAHIIESNNKRIPGMVDFRNKPWRSVYWEIGNGTDKFLETRGFNRFPVIAPRWDTVTTDDVYGYGPGWHAMGAIKELQKTRRDKLIMQEKLHSPPVMQDESVQGHANLIPGGVTKTNSTSPDGGVRATYQVSDRLESFLQLIEEEKEEIDRFFFVNLFLMMVNVDKNNMTATEIAERQQEKLMMMGPALHKMDEQMLTPLLTLLYGIMEDNGLLPEFPQELQGVTIKIEYTSIMAQAQRAAGIPKMERVLGIVSAAAPLNPDVVDNMDFDEIVRQANDMEGGPAKIIRDPQVVDAVREQRAQQQNAAMAMQAAQAGAKTVKDMAGAKTNEENALTGLMAGMAG